MIDQIKEIECKIKCQWWDDAWKSGDFLNMFLSFMKNIILNSVNCASIVIM